MKLSLHVLIAEDNPADAELVLRELRHAGFDPDWHRVDTEAEYLDRLHPDLDIILSDYEMPQFGGLRPLELLKESGLDIPFIIISGTIGEEIAVEVMKHGAADYLLKDRLTRLGAAVQRALQEVRERAERRRLEAQFIEAQKTEVIGHLAGGVAHDFNNILAVIMGYGELMLAEMEPGSLMHSCAEEIQHAAERAAGLTRQLLVFSRKQTVLPVVLDLNAVIGELDKMLRRIIDESIEMTVLPGQHLGRIKADSGYIGQVLMNLVVNARDAMPAGGKVTIATENVTLQKENDPAGTKPGPCVLLSVSDTGTGMTDDVKKHLFEAFFTTKPAGKGTGLGLATCQTIMQQCGGHTAVESELGRGTTFKFYFPQVEENLDTVKSIQEGPAPRGSETLLVVEDEPAVRRMAVEFLTSQGYAVLNAVNGQDGLNVAEEHQGTPISLVVTDVVMPLMSGKVMAEWLKAIYPDVKILFTSGYTDDALTQHGLTEPDIAFLAKPYTPTILARKVREMLDAGP